MWAQIRATLNKITVGSAKPSQPSRPAPEAPVPDRRKLIFTLLLAIAISAAVIVLTTYFRDEIAALGRIGLLGLFFLSALGNATVIIPAPAFVVACAAAPIYGPLATGLVAGIGSAVGEMTGYMAGYGGTAVLPQGKTYRRLRFLMRRWGPLFIFALALIPNPLFDVGGLTAGALKMPPLAFWAATAAGKALRLLLVALACNGSLPFVMEFFGAQQSP
jgi:membrane protein YqaA with SNARE-associated domain